MIQHVPVHVQIGQNGEHARRLVEEEHNQEHEHVRVVQHVVLKQMNETVL